MQKYVHVHMCVILGKWRLVERKTRFAILAHDNNVTGATIADFSNEAHGADEGSGALACGGAQETPHVLLHVRADGDSPVSWR